MPRLSEEKALYFTSKKLNVDVSWLICSDNRETQQYLTALKHNMDNKTFSFVNVTYIIVFIKTQYIDQYLIQKPQYQIIWSILNQVSLIYIYPIK